MSENPPIAGQSLELPQWLKPLSVHEVADLRRQNMLATFELALDTVLCRMVDQGCSLAESVKQDHRDFPYSQFLGWIMRDEGRKARYHEAQALAAEVVFDQLTSIADAEDTIEDVQRSTLKVNTRKWWLGVVNRKRFGDVKQVEQNVTLDIGEAMAEAQARVARGRGGPVEVVDTVVKEIR